MKNKNVLTYSTLFLIIIFFLDTNMLKADWPVIFGGSDYDEATAVIQTTDNYFVVCGYTMSFGAGSGDFYVAKLNQAGDQVWVDTYWGSDGEYAEDIIETDDGGYAVIGYTGTYGAGNQDVWLVKLSISGELEWSRTYGGDHYEQGFSLKQTSDGGYIIGGTTMTFGTGLENFYLIKTDSSGTEEWSSWFGGGNNDYGRAVLETVDGGFLLVGGTASFGVTYGGAWMVKTDSEGAEEWTQLISGSSWDCFTDVQQTSDNGFILGGFTYSYGAGIRDFYLVKTDETGNLTWQNTFGGAGSDDAFSIDTTNDGGYLIAGETGSYGNGNFLGYLVKTDSLGNQVWANTYGSSENDGFRDVKQLADNSIIIAGYTKNNSSGFKDFWIVRTDENGNMVGIENNYELAITNYELKQNYPNPFNPMTKISFQLAENSEQMAEIVVYNSVGQQVWSSPITDHALRVTGSILFDGSEFNSGVYYYSLIIDGEKMDTKAMLLIK